jgi:hypothetical protein
MLAEADLISFVTRDKDLMELTTWRQQYLDGDLDVEHHPDPQHPAFKYRYLRI